MYFYSPSKGVVCFSFIHIQGSVFAARATNAARDAARATCATRVAGVAKDATIAAGATTYTAAKDAARAAGAARTAKGYSI